MSWREDVRAAAVLSSGVDEEPPPFKVSTLTNDKL